jgi:hypothetical protein
MAETINEFRLNVETLNGIVKDCANELLRFDVHELTNDYRVSVVRQGRHPNSFGEINFDSQEILLFYESLIREEKDEGGKRVGLCYPYAAVALAHFQPYIFLDGLLKKLLSEKNLLKPEKNVERSVLASNLLHGVKTYVEIHVAEKLQEKGHRTDLIMRNLKNQLVLFESQEEMERSGVNEFEDLVRYQSRKIDDMDSETFGYLKPADDFTKEHLKALNEGYLLCEFLMSKAKNDDFIRSEGKAGDVISMTLAGAARMPEAFDDVLRSYWKRPPIEIWVDADKARDFKYEQPIGIYSVTKAKVLMEVIDELVARTKQVRDYFECSRHQAQEHLELKSVNSVTSIVDKEMKNRILEDLSAEMQKLGPLGALLKNLEDGGTTDLITRAKGFYQDVAKTDRTKPLPDSFRPGKDDLYGMIARDFIAGKDSRVRDSKHRYRFTYDN